MSRYRYNRREKQYLKPHHLIQRKRDESDDELQVRKDIP